MDFLGIASAILGAIGVAISSSEWCLLPLGIALTLGVIGLFASENKLYSAIGMLVSLAGIIVMCQFAGFIDTIHLDNYATSKSFFSKDKDSDSDKKSAKNKSSDEDDEFDADADDEYFEDSEDYDDSYDFEDSYDASEGPFGGEASGEVYRIGETWSVPDNWDFTITGVQKTDERNQFDDPADNVYIISYTYNNTGWHSNLDESDQMLYFSIDLADAIVDSQGHVGRSYPGDIRDYPDETPVGANSTGESQISLENDGSFTIYMGKFDKSGKQQQATFKIDL